MKTPEEYASDLVEKYADTLPVLAVHWAKSCALIDVQNTIDALPLTIEPTKPSLGNLNPKIKYYQEVKTILTNL